jgi:hypothetical protein
MRRLLIARAMTTCCICSVPSKMSVIVEGATVAAPRTR